MEIGRKRKVGNFVLTKKRDGKSTFITAGTLRGEWEVRFRADDRMYGLFNDLNKEDEGSVHTLLSTMLAACHIVDAGFTDDLLKAINAYAARVSGDERSEEEIEKESQKIIEEERRVHEMREELKNSKGKDDGGDVDKLGARAASHGVEGEAGGD